MNKVRVWLQDTVGAPTHRATTEFWPCGCSVTCSVSLEYGNAAGYESVSLCPTHREEYEMEVQAVREGLEEYSAGEMTPLDEWESGK